MRIELVGGMGVGKTTLCRVLEEVGYNCIYEDLGQNPFMNGLYQDPDAYKLPSQIWFILSKFHEIQTKVVPGRVNVLDQAVDNYKAYSRMLFGDNSDPKGFDLVNSFFDYTESRFGQPDLLVYLKVSPETQLKRVRSRNRSFEMNVELDYLVNLKTELDLVVEETKSKGVNVIEIDTETIFLPEHHLFARQLAEDIAEKLNFCLYPDQRKQA